jgi:O-antigen/teichoic acid export membrane protein
MYFYVANRSLLCLDGVAPAEAEGLVGQLASGVFIPMQLMQFIGGFSGTTLFPYLSRDWESGRKAEVCRQFYTALKLVTLIYCAAALMVLVASPLLFDGLLRGRYNSGREVLSWALALYAWMNILYFTQIFVWCAERPWRVAWAMVPGVLVQWLAGLWLVPALGLHGTVLALILGHLVTVALLLYFCHGYGLPADRSLLITLLIPFAFLFDSGCTAWLILLAGISLFHTDWILGRAERVVCLDRIRALAARGAALLHRRSTLPTR